jgi:hypothetical protein
VPGRLASYRINGGTGALTPLSGSLSRLLPHGGTRIPLPLRERPDGFFCMCRASSLRSFSTESTQKARSNGMTRAYLPAGEAAISSSKSACAAGFIGPSQVFQFFSHPDATEQRIVEDPGAGLGKPAGLSVDFSRDAQPQFAGQ